ncbi:MAG TPA: serine hydrolase domain-containing protein, partial [Blastocatellia bacterium]|nr:serine hydrolase domain-containing protein [Blastocatellia bacterium]
RLGSLTKQFTSASILLLEERGKLSLDDHVRKYLPDAPASWDAITIFNLLTHTSGIFNYTALPDFTTTMPDPLTPAQIIAKVRDRALDFEPGSKMSYSNSGYIALGHIIEKVAGESYESFLQKNIFDPLKMSGSGYDRADTILKNRATGYSFKNGKRINSEYLDMTLPHAAGALYSTVEDLFTWNEALFSDKLLSPKSREAMMTVDKNDYAYGLAVSQQHNRKMVLHGGGINGFATFLARFPEEKVTIAVLRNTDYDVPGPNKISQDLAAIVFGEKYELPSSDPALGRRP